MTKSIFQKWKNQFEKMEFLNEEIMKMENKRKLLVVSNEVQMRKRDITTAEMKTNEYMGITNIPLWDTVLIDNNDNIKDLILSYDWLLDTNGYPVTRIGTKDIKMHQLIMKTCFGEKFVPTRDTGKVIDHLNNNRCDNRLRNLHILSAKENNNKKLLDCNWDNLTVYIEYDYNLDWILSSSNMMSYTYPQAKKKYDNRKYILSYMASDMIFGVQDQKEPFNTFELEYSNYEMFIQDINHISTQTKEVNRINKLAGKNSQHKDLKEIKTMKDIQLCPTKKQKQLQAIVEILNYHNWQEIRNLKNNIFTKQEWENLSEEEKQLYIAISKTAIQYLPPDIPKI